MNADNRRWIDLRNQRHLRPIFVVGWHSHHCYLISTSGRLFLDITAQVDRYISFLRGLLTPQRLQHSIGVMQVMAELAEIYSLDRVQAITAGLLHDAAKDLSVEQQLALSEEAGLDLTQPCDRHPVYLHAQTGAYLVSKELGITDGTILGAIATHSYAANGHDFDAPLSQCLRSADILAPLHEWKGLRKLTSMVYAGQMAAATLLQCGWLIEYFQVQGIPVHSDLTQKYNTLSTSLAVERSFFDRW
jgi:predicted HD superfamily hydrolase involved in NAD metabolism